MLSVRKRWVVLPLVILLSVLVGCNEKSKKVPEAVKEKLIAVHVHTLHKESYPIWVDFSGKTQAVDKVMVIARVSGELEKNVLLLVKVSKKDKYFLR